MIPRIQAPIVLVHGLLGFDEFRFGQWKTSYFPNILDQLRSAGNVVFVARLSPVHGVADRAAELKGFIDTNIPDGKVHLIAHSMGGLDSRYAISHLGLHDRVLSLTSIGTPHLGTAFADWGVDRLERWVRPVFEFFGLPCQAFYDLTKPRCQEFNDKVRDVEEVRYMSVSGELNMDWGAAEWHLPHRIVLNAEGPNDGVVSIESSKYGEHHEVWEGDHMSLINWQSPVAQARGLMRERTPYYGKLLQRLVDMGF